MRDLEKDTIVALATPEGEGGLAVVRVSGPGAVDVARRVFKSRKFGSNPVSHVAVYGILGFPNDYITDSYEPIDQVLALPLLAPASYTGEDTVEFFCHGGRAVARQAVAACRAAGARPATPGEFTRRAFLNGRMSLDQAEAVADLIHAESRQAARAAMRQLLGGLNQQLTAIEGPLLDLLSQLEGSLEFLEEEEVGVSAELIVQILKQSITHIDDLLVLAPAGRLLRDGVQVVLTGPANVGKSSLFNALVQEDRAIVDEEAGTTRDVVTAAVEKGGTRFVFHDTAGLRDEAGRVEKMGIDRTLKAAGEADIVLELFEASAGRTMSRVVNEAVAVIPVMTKVDVISEPDPDPDVVQTSSVDGRGLPQLWSLLQEVVAGFGLNDAVAMGVVINERHHHRLEECRSNLAVLLAEFTEASGGTVGPGDEVVGSMLSSILSDLGEISGRVFSEQLLESIFSRFCVGK
jgi:tRNA modification GTPase